MIGLLNAYLFEHQAQSYQREYGPMFLNFLKTALPDQPVRVYNVGLGELPKTTGECNGWIVTGSSKGAYDNDPWVTALGAFIQTLDREKRKLIGVCFGHQLIAHYLGGRTEKSTKGWGVGVRNFKIDQHKPWMQPQLQSCSLLFSHQDQVVKLPNGAELLGHDEFCPNQMYSIANHIFSFQGHPEFTPQFAKDRLDTRMNLIGQDTYSRAIASLGLKTNAHEIGEWMQLFLTLR